MDVELRQLRALVAVAEHGSFTAAAAQLHLTQQSVSALVRKLETNLDTMLFERTTRRVTPTPAGEALLDALKPALDLLDDALTRARSRSSKPVQLHLAFTPATSYGALHELFQAVSAARLPQMQVRELWADELTDAVRERRFHAGLAVEIEPSSDLDIRPWRRPQIELLVSKRHAFAHRAAVRVEELDGATVAIADRAANVGLDSALLNTFQQVGVRPSILRTPRISGSVAPEVTSGEAVTVWLSGMDTRYVPDGHTRIPLVDPVTTVTISFVTTKTPASPDVIDALAALLDVIDHTADT